MGNKERGIFDIDVDGKTLKMQFTANALCALEDASGKGAVQFVQGLEKQAEAGDLRLASIRLLVWAGLKQHQPKISIEDAGNVIDALGDLGTAMEKISAAFSASMPDADGKAPDAGKGADAGKKQTGAA